MYFRAFALSLALWVCGTAQGSAQSDTQLCLAALKAIGTEFSSRQGYDDEAVKGLYGWVSLNFGASSPSYGQSPKGLIENLDFCRNMLMAAEVDSIALMHSEGADFAVKSLGECNAAVLIALIPIDNAHQEAEARRIGEEIGRAFASSRFLISRTLGMENALTEDEINRTAMNLINSGENATGWATSCDKLGVPLRRYLPNG